MAEPIYRTDADGVWRSDDGGASEYLVDPSPEWEARRAAAEDVFPADPVVVAAEAIRDEITDRLAPSGVNSIAEVKAAVIDGLDAAVARLSS